MADYQPFGSLAPYEPPNDGLARLQLPPRNPARLPPAVENALYGMSAQPAYDLGMYAGSIANGQGWNNPELGAGLMGAMGLLAPMKAGVLGPRTGIRAFHGSPHDFEKFDISRIGSGEGNQSYGHGLYFAESPQVAHTYRRLLTQDQGTPAAQSAQRWIGAHGSRDAAIAQIEDLFANGGVGKNTEPRLRETLGILKSGQQLPGKMYEVNINAKPEQFLDWDRPLSGQSPEIQRVLDPLREKVERDWSVNPTLGKPTTTGQVISGLNNIYGAPQEASAALRDAGIPGIRYLDQGSRGKAYGLELSTKKGPYETDPLQFGSLEDAQRAAADYQAKGFGTKVSDIGSRNYVLFRDDIVDILKKWGLFGGMAGGAAAAGGVSDANAKPFGSLNP